MTRRQDHGSTTIDRHYSSDSEEVSGGPSWRPIRERVRLTLTGRVAMGAVGLSMRARADLDAHLSKSFRYAFGPAECQLQHARIHLDRHGRYTADLDGVVYDVERERQDAKRRGERLEAERAAEQKEFDDENRARLDKQHAADRERKDRDRRRRRDQAILSAGDLLANGNYDAASLLADQHGFELPSSAEKAQAARHDQLRRAAAFAEPMLTAASAEELFASGPAGTWAPATTVIDGSTEWVPPRPATSPPAKKARSATIIGTIGLEDGAKELIEDLNRSVEALLAAPAPATLTKAAEATLTEKTAAVKRRLDEEALGKPALDPIDNVTIHQEHDQNVMHLAVRLESGIEVVRREGEPLTDYFHRAWLAATSPVVSK